MRVSVIPAQITNVEDKITSSLSITQIIILILALLISFFIYLVIPPFLKFSLLKLIPSIILSGSISVLAIRRRDQNLVLNYLILYLSFLLRPRIYVLTPSSKYNHNPELNITKMSSKKVRSEIIPSSRQTDHLSELVKDSDKYVFKFNKKGKLYVQISNI